MYFLALLTSWWQTWLLRADVFLLIDLPTLSLWGISWGGLITSAAGTDECVRSAGVGEMPVLALTRLAQKQGE